MTTLHRLSLGLVLLITTPALAQTPAQSSDVQRLEPGKPVERELKAGETHSYTLTLHKGQFLDAAVNQRGIDVVVHVVGPDSVKLLDIDLGYNGANGDEPIGLEANADGQYRIDVSPFDKEAKSGRYEIRINAVLSPKAYAARKTEELRKKSAVISWLKTNAIPLKTVEAGNEFADLEPLKAVLKDVRFVGLGEATHGTREFFQAKHRLLEFLVREMGFRVFAMEASYASLQTINDYVMGRMDDGPKALEKQGLWNWNTEEVLAMMNWLRTYNVGVAADKRVRFAGMDIQYNQPGKDKLLDYLRRVAPERAVTTEPFFRANLDSLGIIRGVTPEQQQANHNRLDELKGNYNELLVFLELNGVNLSEKTSQTEYEQMREYARVLTQFMDSFGRTALSTSRGSRDQYMADNFRRLIDREPAGTRAVIWAHNDHLTTDANGWMPRPLGLHLRRLYGRQYYALGFSTNQGTFQAREARPNDPAKPQVMAWTLKPAPETTADWYFAQTGVRNFIVDFRSTQKNADVNAWLAELHLMRSLGSTFDAAYEPGSFLPYTLSKHYDGLLFIETTTRARPNPSVIHVAGRDNK